MAKEWTEYDGGEVRWNRSAGRRARRIRVASGVTVIPEEAFRECQHLRAVDLGNVTTISDYAFHGCYKLERVVWTTAPAVEIGDNAFTASSLREIDLSNATKIGRDAFYNSEALERVSIPSSVAEVEASAFCRCKNLTEVELGEGVQVIGASAFRDCNSLLRISIPSSATRIRKSAFLNCTSLSEVTLGEGGQLFMHREQESAEYLERTGGVFTNCNSLAHINIPSVAFVIDIGDSDCQLIRTRYMSKPENWTLVISKWLQYRSPSQLEQAEAKVNEILGRHLQSEEEKVNSIREWFAYCDLLDVTTMLELAIWRVNMDGNDQSVAGGLLASVVSYIFHGAKRQRLDVEARQRKRRGCGSDMNIIIPGVLEYL